MCPEFTKDFKGSEHLVYVTVSTVETANQPELVVSAEEVIQHL